MSAEALEKRARRNEMIATDREGRIVMARYQTATSQARRRKAGRQLDRERDRALSRLEFEECCPICNFHPCRCVRGGHRCSVCHCCPCSCGGNGSGGKVSRGAEIKRLVSRDSHRSLISTQIQNLIRGSNVDLGQNGGKTGPQ